VSHYALETTLSSQIEAVKNPNYES